MKFPLSVFASIVVSSLLSSCNRPYQINGTVEVYGYDGKNLSLVSCSDGSFKVIDSCRVNHGTFHMKGKTDNVRFVVLCKEGEPIMPLYIEGGTTNVSVMPTYLKASGTKQNDLLYGFLQKKSAIDSRYEDFYQKKMNLMISGKSNLNEFHTIEDSINSIVKEAEELIYCFISKNYKEQAAVGIFSMMCNSSRDSSSVTPLMRKILDNAPEEFLDAPNIQAYVGRVGYSSIN
jgi:hypothetical protein